MDEHANEMAKHEASTNQKIAEHENELEIMKDKYKESLKRAYAVCLLQLNLFFLLLGGWRCPAL